MLRLPSAARLCAVPRVAPPWCLVLVLSLSLLTASCTGESGPDSTSEGIPRPGGPVLLLTFEALRADAIGADPREGSASVTPNFDRFANQETWTWSGPGIAASSSPVPSLASLLTGVDVWQHQILSHRAITPRPDRVSFPSALASAGYRVDAFLPHKHFASRLGLLSDAVEVHPLSDLKLAVARASSLGDREMLWIHVPHPGFPMADRRPLLPGLELPEVSPERQIVLRQLMPFADPTLVMPPNLLEGARRLYRHDVAWADHLAGRILDAAATSSDWSSATVVVTALHGMEFAEHQQALFAQNLSRETLEVPLMVKLPTSVASVGGEPAAVSLCQVAATVLEAAGLRAAPALQPSLLRAPSARPALSALYLGDGTNLFSSVGRHKDRTMQLVWHASFASPEPEFYAAQVIESGVRRYPISEPAKRIFRRLETAYARALPLSGRIDGDPGDSVSSIRLSLVEWTSRGGTRSVDDPELASEMAEELRFRWSSFVDRERSPAAERAVWAGDRDE